MIDKNIKMEYNDAKIYYFIPGIYNNELDDYYYKKEKEEYINKNVIKNIMISDKVFCNSSHTKEILERYTTKKIYLFYFNFINYLEYLNSEKEEKEEEEREYEYGVIVSDYKRKIKNIEGIIREMEKRRR